jgi:predicted ribosome quality control (RQC) complex YloA/Tae2 family protein|tara:strand:- start:1116 stop:1595 length:480 start_codon:yes stop_codon:yes gene_type:complete
MVDPVSAIAIAGSAFNALKKGVSIGRDIESMGKDLSRWMSAVSDIDRAHHEAKHPPIFKKLFSGASVEQEAIELFTQKKQLENQRDELRKLISAMCGPNAWQELLRMEADIRKQRKETLYAQREARRHFVEIVSIMFLVITIVGFFIFILFLWQNRGSA